MPHGTRRSRRKPYPTPELKIAAPVPLATPPELLRVDRVSVRFGGITALNGVSFSVHTGHIVGLIGPNGAGKTTLFNCLSRLYSFNEGAILFEGRPLVDTEPHGIASLGIGRTFQNLALFRTMTVRQNILLGGHCRSRTGFFENALRLPRVRREEDALEAHADQLIELLALGPVAEARVMDLPFGTQKRVELARALASEPKLLLLDELVCMRLQRPLFAPHPRQAQRVLEEAGVGAAVAAEQDVLPHRHGSEQRQVLKRAADAERGNAVRPRVDDWRAFEQDAAFVERIQPRQAIEQRRLARAIRADQPDDVAGLHRKRHAIECRDAAEAHRHAIDAQQLGGHGG